MPELNIACARLKLALLNKYAVERYEACQGPKYQHPGWVELQHKQKGAVYGRLKNNAR